MRQAEMTWQGASVSRRSETPHERRWTRSDGDDTDCERFVRLIYDRHRSALIRFAARLLGGDWIRAEDILQEAAIRAWRHMGACWGGRRRTGSGRGSSPSCATW
ncbi:sigma factor [Streptomyces sp. NPDC017673]|uniref:sigma factor n=1 Tax=unclassified Streptomyces TaxID=2593676 RepID=UPI0037B08163